MYFGFGLQIGHDGITPKDGWFIEQIEVDMPTVGKHYFFPCKRWLSKDKEDGQISRVLKVADAESVQYKPSKSDYSFKSTFKNLQ